MDYLAVLFLLMFLISTYATSAVSKTFTFLSFVTKAIAVVELPPHRADIGRAAVRERMNQFI